MPCDRVGVRTRIALIGRSPEARDALARAFSGAPAAWSVTLHDEVPAGAHVVVCAPDASHPGAVRFDPGAPDGAVAEVAARIGRAGVTAVAGAGGGTGATTVALHVAAALAPRVRTCVVDLDPGAAAFARLGLDPPAAGAGEPASDARAIPAHPGFRMVAGPAGLDAAAAFDLVVADVPWRVDAGPLLESAATAVMVVAPTPTGVIRARALLAAAPGARWALVVNRVGPGGETTARAAGRELGRPVALELPCCPALRDAEDDGRLLHRPWSRWGRRIELLARALRDA